MGLQLLAEAPLEALVFRYAVTGGGSLWTWLAVLAAALGLWLIRSDAASPRPQPGLHPRSHSAPAHGERGRDDLPQPKAAPRKQRPPEGEPRSPAPAVDSGVVGFARKVAVFELRGHYIEEEEGGGDDDDDDSRGVEKEEMVVKAEEEEEEEEESKWHGVHGGVIGGCVDSPWKGDLGWYRYQDLAALNGRVVRLWEDEKRVAAAPLKRRWMQVSTW